MADFQSSNFALLTQLFPGQALLSVEQAARAAGLAPGTLRNEIARGTASLRTTKIGRRRLIPLDALAAYLDALTQPAPRPGRPRSTRSGV